MAYKMTMSLKSGRTLYFTCTKFKITTSPITGDAIRIEYTDGKGDVPVFVRPDAIESIAIAIGKEEKGYDH